MKIFEIYDSEKGITSNRIYISEQTGRKALSKYMKDNNIKLKVKCSSDFYVRFCVTPVIEYNGKMCIDGSRRKSWYKVI